MVSELLQRVQDLVVRGELRVSDHGYDELAADGILAREAVHGLPEAEVVEEYPDFPKGPCVLVLQRDRDGRPVHVLWGIPAGATTPAVLVTAYRPDSRRWDDDFLRRRQ